MPACNCIGGNPCPCQRGSWPIGRITFGPEFTAAAPHWPNGELVDLLAKAKLRIMTPKEAYDQKVSWIYGQLMECNPNVTVEEIKRHLAEMGVVDPEFVVAADTTPRTK